MGHIIENIGETVCKDKSFSKLLVDLEAVQATQSRKEIKF
jgi:hypothetical protein